MLLSLVELFKFSLKMESINFGYSTKNIPVARPCEYKRKLIEKTEALITRMRWRAFHFLNPEVNSNQINSYGFKSTATAPHIKELQIFEAELTKLIQNVKFKPYTNELQLRLNTDLKEIDRNDRLYIKADKTSNYYKMNSDSYDKLLHDNITKTYKKAPDNCMQKINTKDKQIAKELELDNRIETLAKKQAFITLKDHKPNFSNNPTCRLINPTKSELGKISKGILDKINCTLISNLTPNIWKNTDSVIDWFNQTTNKKEQSFIVFDICDFYPSITEELLGKALQYAESTIDIPETDKTIIKHTKQALLFHKDQLWTKRDSSSNFDVTMGSFDGAETCTLVGIYLLSQLPKELQNRLGLYRDDGLAICNDSPRNIENMKKQICTIFKRNKLKITIEANKKIVNFLDITMDLNRETYMPYTKPNNTIQYVHKQSNHPPSIIKNIPIAINRRLNKISSSKQEFDKASEPYQKALQKSGYSHILEYSSEKEHKQTSTRKRQRNVTWYNPPYSANVQTNIGRQFLRIIDTCFPKPHPLNKIFNRYTLKLSYSTMPNIKNRIEAHNKKINNKPITTENTQMCNCRNTTECPLEQKCLTQNVIYQATVTRQDNKTQDTYIGLCETKFKTRYYNHKTSFKHINKRNQTELSKHIWSLKERNIGFEIKWKIIKQAKPYSNATKKCNLCLTEKYFIIYKPEMSTLNKRNELASACRHKKQYLLCNTK